MFGLCTRILTIAVAAAVVLAIPASAARHGSRTHDGDRVHPRAHVSAPMSRGAASRRSRSRAHMLHASSHASNRYASSRAAVRHARARRELRAHVGGALHVSHVSGASRFNPHHSFAVRTFRSARIAPPAAPATLATGTLPAHGARWNGRADWWRQRTFFGWAGPLFWPYFYDDLWYDVLSDWGPGYFDDPFWAYGYGDIYGALFSPYGFDDLAGFAPAPSRPAQPASASQPTQWSAMCGSDAQAVDLPIERISAAVSPTDQQRAALDALANASVQAAHVVKSACPSDVAYTPTGRLDTMQHRVDAMVQAVALVRAPLDAFYASLTDEQKARLNAFGYGEADRVRATTQACGPHAAAIPIWPQAQIEKAVRPDERQRGLLDKLKDASVKAAEMLEAACPRDPPATPPARLAAAATRLDALLGAVKLVHVALADFYGSLSDEQKARFNALGCGEANGARGTAPACGPTTAAIPAPSSPPPQAEKVGRKAARTDKPPRALLHKLKDASTRAAQRLKAAWHRVASHPPRAAPASGTP
jgi:hypothetical protein